MNERHSLHEFALHREFADLPWMHVPLRVVHVYVLPLLRFSDTREMPLLAERCLELSIANTSEAVRCACSLEGVHSEQLHLQIHARFTAVLILRDAQGHYDFLDLSWRFMQKGQSEAFWFVRHLHRDLITDMAAFDLGSVIEGVSSRFARR